LHGIGRWGNMLHMGPRVCWGQSEKPGSSWTKLARPAPRSGCQAKKKNHPGQSVTDVSGLGLLHHQYLGTERATTGRLYDFLSSLHHVLLLLHERTGGRTGCSGILRAGLSGVHRRGGEGGGTLDGVGRLPIPEQVGRWQVGVLLGRGGHLGPGV